MIETFVTNNPALVIPCLAVVCATVFFIVWVIAHYWRQMRKLDVESALKQDMLNRGLAPADIERVLLASVDPPQEEANEAKETISDNEYYLVEKMLDEGRSVEDIERLVRAFKEGKNPSQIRLPSRVEA